jgi:23S rRNA (uracil1939-C5)-methyltransferase
VFVPRTAPGDLIEADIAQAPKARFARGRLVRVLEPSAARVAPTCPHYVHQDCGGCQLQHLTYEAQVHAKGAMVAEAFQRIAKRDVHVPAVHAATAPWRYRQKLTLAVRQDASGQRLAGLRAYDAPDTVFALHDCPITDERVLAAWRAVLDAAVHLPDAPELRVAVRKLGDGVAIVVEGGAIWASPESLAEAVPSARAIWWLPEHGRRRLLVDRRSGAEPGASFVQVNPAMADGMARYVVDRVLSYRPRGVIDAYAGAGDTAVALDAAGVRVTAIEADHDAAEYAASRLGPRSRAVADTVERALSAALPADVVLVNPPRAGLDATVTAALSAAKPRPTAIVYVSCDPATLARDVGRLPGWRVAHITCFDLFPQTAHVETVCELVPEAG